MRKPMLTALLLTCALVISGCATNSVRPSAPSQVCPVLPPAPASVMQPVELDFQKAMSGFLFDSPNGLSKSPSSLKLPSK